MPAVRIMLMLSDREEISRGLAEGLQCQEIALRMGRDPSVISREVARHGGRDGYRAAAADEAACAARERPKVFAVERCPRLRAVVCRQLRGGWSPASIAGRLPADYPEDDACRVSHEAIYQWVYAQPVSTLARELISLRTGRTAARGDPPVADLGLRHGDGPARHDHRDRAAGVLRPPALAVGTRQQREPRAVSSASSSPKG